jgi:hypothetical protein
MYVFFTIAIVSYIFITNNIFKVDIFLNLKLVLVFFLSS